MNTLPNDIHFKSRVSYHGWIVVYKESTYNTCPDMAKHLLMQGLGTCPGGTLWHGSTPDRSTHDTAVSCSLWLICYCQPVLISPLHITVWCSLSCLLFHTGANTITTAHLTGVNHLIYYNICVSMHPFTTLPFTILVSYIENEWRVTQFWMNSHWIVQETAFNVYKLEVLREETLLLWQHLTN